MDVTPSDLKTKDIYKLLTGSVVPRPIAWVSTVSEEGVHNLAPFSFFTVASTKPAILAISIGQGSGERLGAEKDTLANIRTQKEFVINVVSCSLGNEMQKSAENVPAEVDEFEHAGFTPIDSKTVQPKRVKEALIHMECKLHQILPLGSNALVLGEMTHYHIQDEVYLGNYKIDLEKLSPLGRLAGNYSESKGFFTLPR
ncbi:flavin reductase family protein [Pseudalkalibacillus hwajinpoensis]|uniref:flavin reductase family protein n=1 Tax=Guptibacillus hwajinpoensis TaxID=208199 RepID=UPI001CD4E771|nr:flavin reductase family protein [Pseudalkalibacillus hwajinpoensis]MCA0993486.1 flavin reductase family protein [Pseudalkalibacillus hwajinpoensis]